MDRIPLLKEGSAAQDGCGAHNCVADASLPIIGLHCDIADVLAAARRRGLDEYVVRR